MKRNTYTEPPIKLTSFQRLASSEPLNENNVRMDCLYTPTGAKRFLDKTESVEEFMLFKHQVIDEQQPVTERETHLVARIVIMRWRQKRLEREQQKLSKEGHKLLRRQLTPFPIRKLLRVLSVSPYRDLRDRLMDVSMKINMLERSCKSHSLMIKNSKLQRLNQTSEGVV